MKQKDWRPFVYGGIASVVAELGTFPMDMSKTRLQVQGQQLDASHAKLKYRGMIHCMITVAKEEGFRAMYSGIWPATLRQATYGTLKIGIYYSLKDFIQNYTGKETVTVNFCSAVLAGVVSSVIANPTDVLKVRMQVKGSDKEKLGMVGSFKDIYTNEGLPGLWRGVSLTAQRAGIIVGVQLPVYDFFKKFLAPTLGDHVVNHFFSSLAASFGGAVTSTPIDVMRSRMMNQKNIKTTSGDIPKYIYKSSLDCYIKTFKTEGFWAFYKGFIPTWLRLGPWNVLFFMTYEQLKMIY